MEPVTMKKVERDGVKYRISVYHDQDAGDPTREFDGVGEIYSFCSRHRSYDADARAREANNRDAVPLGYFEHGQCVWFVFGAAPPGADCPWDGVPFAGLWVPDKTILDEASSLTGKDRRDLMWKRAAQACVTYTQWCNGDIYGYTVERLESCDKCRAVTAETLDGCWGIYGSDEAIREAEAFVATQ